MKAFLALTFLAALSLAVGVDLKKLKPLDIVVPVNPRHTWQEWQEIFAAQVPSPGYNPLFKLGTEPQSEFPGKVHVFLKEQANRITNGLTASRGQFPWQVALIIEYTWLCGGSVISSQWVLTAAQCAGTSYEVILGANRIDTPESGSLTVLASNIIVHPQYNSSNLDNDIALVQLPYAVTFTTYISPIRLRNIAGDLAGARVRVSGWGKTSDSSSSVSTILKYVDLTVITNTQCAGTYGNNITSTKLCTATTGGQSTCNGDIGGPLVYLESDSRYTQVGIVSFGSPAGCTVEYPVAFTRVTSYREWIQSITGIGY